jgi:hypothetical protein
VLRAKVRFGLYRATIPTVNPSGLKEKWKLSESAALLTAVSFILQSNEEISLISNAWKELLFAPQALEPQMTIVAKSSFFSSKTDAAV